MLTRRVFFAASSAVFAAPAQRIRLGGPTFLKSNDPAEIAREHRRLGYAAAYCPAASIQDRERIAAIEKAFLAEDVVIAEVGAWKNLLDLNPAERRKNFDYVAERLALADAVGARCCVDIAGSFHPKLWDAPHPRNLTQEHFDATVELSRKLIDQVKPRRTKWTVEMMGWMTPTGPDQYLRLLKAVDRSAFAVHLDPCNGINSPERYYNNGAFIEECFAKLGRWIVSCHAKDLQWLPESSVHFVEVIPGRGDVDYRPYLRALSQLRDVPLMLEHLKTADEYAEAAGHIRKVAAGEKLPISGGA